MRTALCVALLSLCLGVSQLSAQDISTAQAQQLVSAAQSAPANAKPVDVTLSIAGKNVVFKVSRDALGTVVARPVPGPDSAGSGISQVSIQMRINANGSLEPTNMVVVSENNTILSYQLSLNQDGTIASVNQAGTFAAGTGAGAPPIVGGINGKNGDAKASKTMTQNNGYVSSGFPAFNSGQQSLPAGAGTGDTSAVHTSVSPSTP